MKSVLISIKPKWCERIANGKKTVEVRKTVPKLETPFKCYIYCTDGAMMYSPVINYGRKMVIGEFVCKKIEHIEIRHFTVFGHENRYAAVGENPDHQWLKKSCLSYDEVVRYGKLAPLYGWHISDLVIYDKAKELREFCIEDKTPCDNRERVYQNPEYNPNGGWILGGNYCRESGDWCKRCKTKPLTRPPQSWCYVKSED